MNIRTVKKREAAAKQAKENSVGWMLKSMCFRMDNDMKKALKAQGLNLGQFAILMTLLQGDGISQTEIGKKIIMPGYATTRNIDVLEQKGLLERHKDEASRRSYCIRLTKKGKSLAPTLFSIIETINQKILSPLNNKETQQLKSLLSKLL